MARHFSDRDRLALLLQRHPPSFTHYRRAMLAAIDEETRAAALAADSLDGPGAAHAVLQLWCEEHPYLDDEQRYCPF